MSTGNRFGSGSPGLPNLGKRRRRFAPTENVKRYKPGNLVESGKRNENVRLTEAQFRRLVGQKGASRIHRRARLGEWRDLAFTVSGISIPSFKNAKQLFVRAGTPCLATKKEYAEVMDRLVGEIQRMALTKHPLTNVEHFFRFYILDYRAADPDGMNTTVIDCLRHAGLIVNDNCKHIARSRGYEHVIVQPGQEGISIELRGQEYIV